MGAFPDTSMIVASTGTSTTLIEEPVPGVVVVTEYESVRTTTPISPRGKPERGEDGA